MILLFNCKGTARTLSPLPKIVHPKQPRFADVANVNQPFVQWKVSDRGILLLDQGLPQCQVSMKWKLFETISKSWTFRNTGSFWRVLVGQVWFFVKNIHFMVEIVLTKADSAAIAIVIQAGIKTIHSITVSRGRRWFQTNAISAVHRQ